MLEIEYFVLTSDSEVCREGCFRPDDASETTSHDHDPTDNEWVAMVPSLFLDSVFLHGKALHRPLDDEVQESREAREEADHNDHIVAGASVYLGDQFLVWCDR